MVAECRKLLMMTGRIAFSSKLPWLPASATAVSSPITWIAIITIASHWVGFTLPGMIDDPGSFCGSLSSPRPQRGPDASQRMSFAIFRSATSAPRSASDAALGPRAASGVRLVGEPVWFGDEALVEQRDRRDMHRGREAVVGGLAHVDVVIGADRLLQAQLTAQQLDGAVRQHLVDVHIRLRARTGLPDEQREVFVQLAGDRLVGGAAHRLPLPFGRPPLCFVPPPPTLLPRPNSLP